MNAALYRVGLFGASLLGTAVWHAYTRSVSPFNRTFWQDNPVDVPPPDKPKPNPAAPATAPVEAWVGTTKPEDYCKTLDLLDAPSEAQANDGRATSELERGRSLALRDYFVDLVGWGKFVFIDSNIWMDQAHEAALLELGRGLVRRQTRLIILNEQYAEIEKLKKTGSDAVTKARARHALRLIKELTSRGALKFTAGLDRAAVHDVDGFVIRRFLDPCFEEGRAAVFVSNDVPFLTRVYDLQHTARRVGKDKLFVLEGQEFDLLFDPDHA